MGCKHSKSLQNVTEPSALPTESVSRRAVLTSNEPRSSPPSSEAIKRNKEVHVSSPRGSKRANNNNVLLPNVVSTAPEQVGSPNDIIAMIRSSVVGTRTLIGTPFGNRELVYADYTASGRYLSFVEEYMLQAVAPMYANTHTEASSTGMQTTRFREEARIAISEALNAPLDVYAVLFAGTGCTGAIDKIVRVLGFSLPEYADKKWNLSTNVPDEERPIVFIGPHEHHSNELVWRESLANVVVIEEDKNGFPDLAALEAELIKYENCGAPLIGSFSAGSNVTGLKSDTRGLASLLHQYGAYAFFDYAGVGAYVDIDVHRGGGPESMDAVFLSPHKLVGGPGSAGVLVARRKLLNGAFDVPLTKPSMPGGGTVNFVSKYNHSYSDKVEDREDAGTPGIPQCVRSGLVFKIKDMVGSHIIEKLEAQHGNMALTTWRKHPRISLIGADREGYFDQTQRVPIISFAVLSSIAVSDEQILCQNATRIAVAQRSSILPTNSESHSAVKQDLSDAEPKLLLHHNFVVAVLNDVYGIQARGGCSCAGPYGLRLYGIDKPEYRLLGDTMLDLAKQGYESFKPGWARLNFNYFISEEEAKFVIEAVEQVATHGWKLLPFYIQDPRSGQYKHRNLVHDGLPLLSLNDLKLNPGGDSNISFLSPATREGRRTPNDFRNVLQNALQLYNRAAYVVSHCRSDGRFRINGKDDFTSPLPDGASETFVWWVTPSGATKEIQGRRRCEWEGPNLSLSCMQGIDDVGLISKVVRRDDTKKNLRERKTQGRRRPSLPSQRRGIM